MNIGVIGCNGFVGSALCRYISNTENKLIPIHRGNFSELSEMKFDILINAATPSKKYWAFHNPLADFEASVGLTAKIVHTWQYNKLVQISSISAQSQLDHPYGIHRYLGEQLVLTHNKGNLVIRLGGLFGTGLNKGIIYDIIHNNTLFVSGDSRYTFLHIDTAAEMVYMMLKESGVKSLSSNSTISLTEIVEQCKIERTFGDRLEILPEPDNDEGPNVFEVVTYIKQSLANEKSV